MYCKLASWFWLQSPVLPFNDSILLRSPDSREVMRHTMFFAVLSKAFILEFRPMVRSDGTQRYFEGLLQLTYEGFEFLKNFVFRRYEYCPSILGVIIKMNKHILISPSTLDSHRTTKIHANEFKRLRGTYNLFYWKRCVNLFPPYTCIINVRIRTHFSKPRISSFYVIWKQLQFQHVLVFYAIDQWYLRRS